MVDLLVAVIFDPRMAAYVGALLAGHPAFGERLEKICERESNCTAVHVHEDDAGRSRSVWTMAARAGLIDAQCQPHRRRAWSTRGAYGTMAAFTVHHLGACMPPWMIDVPLFAAIASTRRAHDPKCMRARSCRRWAWS